MAFLVKSSPEGRAILQLTGEPAYCHALDAAPEGREPMLGQGLWLVMSFARWSRTDIASIQAALDAVCQFDGAVQLGARPFDDPEEMRTWIPEYAGEMATPIWALLKDGLVVFQGSGPRSPEDLVGAIKTHLVKA